MNKKILLISVVLLAFAMSVSFVSAMADINTPDGYKLNDGKTVIEQAGEFQGKDAKVTIVVMENGTDNITITTFAVDGDVDLSSAQQGAKNKTINGKDGLVVEKDGRSIFLYKVGEQYINIDAPNEKLIEKVIV